MKPEAQRIAIAEACGWQGWWSQDRGVWWVSPEGERVMVGSVPDYLNSLDAMHEAEKVLTDTQFEEFVYRLCAGQKWKQAELNLLDVIFTAKATASQRAEAFLRTIGKWTE